MEQQAKKKILIVEDEKNIAQLLAFNLVSEGYACDIASDGEEGLRKALTGEFDLVLLDIMLPKLDGFDVCIGIRKKLSVPIIMLTAREEEKDKIMGLENGADDYITKPYSLKELISRVRANIRRSSGEFVSAAPKDDGGKSITLDNLVIDCEKYSVTRDGTAIELSKLEYDLLLFLAKNAEVPFSREDLLDKVWGYSGFYGDVGTVDVTVSRLRRKVEADPSNPSHLLTKRGVGYYIK